MSHDSRRSAPPSALRHAIENPLVIAANAAFADPQFAQTVREMHAQNYPLIRMVTDLGLDDEMTPEIRAVVEALPPDVVDAIRAATLAMLDREEQVLPVQCDITDDELRRVAVDVSVGDVGGRSTIQVRRT